MSPKETKRITSAYETEQSRLLGYIRKRIPGGVEAEDILQDIFYQLTVGFNDLRRIENLTAWLYKVADNRIIDLFRKKRNNTISYSETAKEDEDGPLSLAEILPSGEQAAIDEDLKEMIWETIEDTLASLPEEQRTVFIANEFEELSFREISENTGIPVNTLLSRKRYAVLALRKNLGELYKLLKDN
jgi:RNA polymerase sigma factor (sigma-70 family)